MNNNSLYSQFLETATKFPNYIALRFEEKTWTYKEVNKQIQLTALKLVSLGVKEKDVITLALPSSPYSIFLFYAVNLLGAISFNIHPLLPNSSIEEMMIKANSKKLFCLGLQASSLRETLPNDFEVISINPYSHSALFKKLYFDFKSPKNRAVICFSKIKKSKKELPIVHINPLDDAVYLNTGGTSGERKIVRLSNLAINHIAKNSYQLIGGPYQDIKILTAIPLFHIFGLEMGVHTPFSFGGTSVLELRFRTKEAIKYIKKGEATVLLGVPSLYKALLSRDAFYGPFLKKQITAFIGGDSVPTSLIDRWNRIMIQYGSEARLYEGYGLTETGVVCVSTKGRNKIGSIGRPLPGVSLKILDINTHQELPFGEKGEFALGGPSLMNGYLDDDKLNKESFVTLNNERYFLTKDYGYSDEDGFNFFKERLRRTYKIKGETVCPSDVEDVVLPLEDVFDAFCYGVKNERNGSAFRLLLVKRDGDHPKSEEEVVKIVREAISAKLEPVYQPEKIFFIKSLPRTPIGKVDEKELQKLDYLFN